MSEENAARMQISPDAGQDGHVQSPSEVETQPADSGNIDKIREILFGGQMRDYDRRFSRVEERLIRETLELREDTRKRFDQLESFIKSEFAALSERLQQEHRTRDEAVQGLWRGLHETTQSLANKLAEFHDNNMRAQSDLRQQILDQSKELNDEMRRRQEEITAMLQREVAGLTHDKTDRSALATLFTELALRLNNDLKMPVSS
ncbi:MAG: hypothetical protein C5B55_04575 [Blastocatellia bacterium]|nr:MAG: hypothetical protein C5B55_04575 [Blastocatellia bacterium]